MCLRLKTPNGWVQCLEKLEGASHTYCPMCEKFARDKIEADLKKMMRGRGAKNPAPPGIQAKPEQAILVIEYLWDPSYERGAKLIESLAGMPIKAVEGNDKLYTIVGNSAMTIAQSAKDLRFLPEPPKGTIRFFHSMLEVPSDGPWAAIRHVLRSGLSVRYSRKYQSQYGDFSGIWTQTDTPYNENVPWFAIDVPRSSIDEGVQLEIDDQRRTQPHQEVIGMDIPAKWIAGVSGFPVEVVKRALGIRSRRA